MRGCRSKGRQPAAAAGGGGGGRAVRPEYADRLSAADSRAFEQFVRGGGTFICLNSASNFAIQQFKLPVTNVAAGLRPDEFFLHGTIVEVTTDPSQQVMAGMAEKAAVFADSSPVFETLDGFKGKVLAKYQDTGSPLLSGYLIGEKVSERQGGGIGRAAGCRACHPPGIPARVARPAVRHVQGPVQRGARRRPLTAAHDEATRRRALAPDRDRDARAARRAAPTRCWRTSPTSTRCGTRTSVRVLLAKYPRTSADALLEARAYAYGGSSHPGSRLLPVRQQVLHEPAALREDRRLRRGDAARGARRQRAARSPSARSATTRRTPRGTRSRSTARCR